MPVGIDVVRYQNGNGKYPVDERLQSSRHDWQVRPFIVRNVRHGDNYRAHLGSLTSAVLFSGVTAFPCNLFAFLGQTIDHTQQMLLFSIVYQKSVAPETAYD